MDKVYVIGRDAIPQFLRMEAGEQLRMTFVALPGTTARLALEVEIAGPGCDLDLAAAYVCSGSDDLRMNVLVRHACGGSTSRQLIKGLAGGGAPEDRGPSGEPQPTALAGGERGGPSPA